MAIKRAGRGSTPIAVIGAGYLGIQAASALRRRGCEVVLLDGGDQFGGKAWLQHANRGTSRLQTESASYALDFEDGNGAAQASGSHAFHGDSHPSREKVLEHLDAFAQSEGLETRAMFNCWVERVSPVGTPPEGRYEVVYRKGSDARTETLIADAVMAFPGRLGEPNDTQFEGEENFNGSIVRGCGQDGDIWRNWAGRHVAILGHGSFAIENVRRALDAHAARVTIVCQRRYFVAPRVVSWLINARRDGLSREAIQEIGATAYHAVGQIPPGPASGQGATRRPPGLTPISDEYFAGFACGRLAVVEAPIERMTKAGIFADGREIPCDVIIKCLGFSVDGSIDKTLGLKKIFGFWVNGDNRLMVYREGLHNDGVDKMNAINLGPPGKRAILAGIHMLDRPELLGSLIDRLPTTHTACEFGSAHSGDTLSVICSAASDLRMELEKVLDSKAEATRWVHDPNVFYQECRRNWAKYVDSERISYPYDLDQILSFAEQLAEHAR